MTTATISDNLDNASREVIRLALPSKGRMAQDTHDFLQDCGLSIHRPNPRQYIAELPDIPGLEVWFQRTADVVRKVRDGDVDLGIVGFDNVVEYRGTEDDVLVIHEALGYGHCRLSVAVPEEWDKINTMADLADLAKQHSHPRPLRVVSKFQRQTAKFLAQHNVEPIKLLYADGALEASPHMGTADFIVDLISTGVTLRENRLKELSDGCILRGEMVLIGNRTALSERADVLETARKMLELIEAHLRAMGHYNVIANMRGKSPQSVAQKLFDQSDLGGLQGPTISQVYLRQPTETNWYAISIVVRKDCLPQAVQQLRAIGGSGVLVLPLIYIFDEEPPRWRKLLKELNKI